jgi:hypothetical protein
VHSDLPSALYDKLCATGTSLSVVTKLVAAESGNVTAILLVLIFYMAVSIIHGDDVMLTKPLPEVL